MDLYAFLLVPHRERERSYQAVESLGEGFVWEEITHDEDLESRCWQNIAKALGVSESLTINSPDAQEELGT